MADHSTIQWTDATWNIITGCSIVSAGCGKCYAMKLAGSRLRHHPSRVGLTKPSASGPIWTGDVRFNEQWLDQPLRWKRGRRIFVCAHGDLFHENVPDEWIDRVFAVMIIGRQHTYQILTKRAARMRAYLSDPKKYGRWNAQMNSRELTGAMRSMHISGVTEDWFPEFADYIHVGVSVEDQPNAEARIPELLGTPAAVRWVSYEPALGPVRFDQIGVPQKNSEWTLYWNALSGFRATSSVSGTENNAKLSWIVCGGESGRGARPFDIAWARSVIQQCSAAGVACFVKQLGKTPFVVDPDSHNQLLLLRDSHGGDWDEWPTDLRVREFPGETA